MKPIYYGKPREYLWRLGDTSARHKNQIGMNEFYLKLIYDSDSGISNSQVYQKAYEEGFKQKSEDSATFDHSPLITKTLKYLGLIEYDSKKKLYSITGTGEFFYELLNEVDKTGANINVVSKEATELLSMMHLQIKDLIWLGLLMNVLIPKEPRSAYAPFVYLIKQLINNSLPIDFLVDWTYFRCEPKKFYYNNDSDNIIHSEAEIRQQKGKSKYYKNFFDHLENKSLSIDDLRTVLLRNSKNEAFKKNIAVILSNSKLNQKYDLSLEEHKIIPKDIVAADDFLKDALDYIQNKLTFSQFCTMYNNNKPYITARDEYKIINLYWLKGIKVFNFNQDTICMNKANKLVFDYIFKDLSHFDYDYLDFDQFISYFYDSTKIDRLINYLVSNGISKEVIYENNLPYDYEQTKIFISNLDLYFKNTMELDKKKEELGLDKVTNAAVIEYFVNLWVYYSYKSSHPNTKITFLEICNTNLDSELKPNTHASGGQPDGLIVTDDQIIMIETTIINNSSQLYKSELEPINRHLFQAIYNYNEDVKSVSLLFFAPGYDYNFIKGFLKISQEKWGLAQVSVPLDPKKYDTTANPYLLVSNLTTKNFFNHNELKDRETKLQIFVNNDSNLNEINDYITKI